MLAIQTEIVIEDCSNKRMQFLIYDFSIQLVLDGILEMTELKLAKFILIQ